jgi:hypothetical protein
VTWTERAADLLRSGEYRYFSPVIFWTDEEHSDVAALGPVALTNDPAMRGVRPLAAARDLEAGVTADELQAQVEEAQAELAVLRQQLAGQEADAFVERGLRLGKILDSTSLDWRDDYLRDRVATEERLARAPVLRPPGRLIALDPRGEVAGRPADGRNASGLGPWGIDPADWTAYERAVAAGRIRSGRG